MEMELKLLSLADVRAEQLEKTPMAGRLRKDDEGPEALWSSNPLLEEGKHKAKCIGPKGQMRMKIGRASGAMVEYMSNTAYMVGTKSERAHAAELLKAVQTASQGGMDKVPDVLEEICTRVEVPQDAANLLLGPKRADMNRLEDETGTLTFWVPSVSGNKAVQGEPIDLKVGMIIDGTIDGGKRWFDCKVEEIKGDEGKKTVKVRWCYDEKEVSELREDAIRKRSEETVEEKKDAKSKFELKVGMVVDGTIDGGKRWFDCKVQKITGEAGNRTIKVSWNYDENEVSELKEDAIREFVDPEKKEDKPKSAFDLKVGMVVDGTVNGGKRWFDGKIVKITGEEGNRTIKVRWNYDENEVSDLKEDAIREFVDPSLQKKKDAAEALTAALTNVKAVGIFGSDRARKLAELKIMGITERKYPGAFSGEKAPACVEPGSEAFGLEKAALNKAEVTRAEKRRKAMANASACIIEMVGDSMYIAGTGSQRARAIAYVSWAAMEKLCVPDFASRSDVEELMLPKDKVKNLTALVVATVEGETSTFCLFDDGATEEGQVRLLVCSTDAGRRSEAIEKIQELKERKPPPEPKGWGEDTDWGVSSGGSRDDAKRKAKFVVAKDEEERRKKRAARFG